jgi:hypothetical protein
VDFIIGNLDAAIEVKGSEKITSDHLKGLREFKKEYPQIKNQIVVCLEKQPRKTSDGILILPYEVFIEKLFDGEIY